MTTARSVARAASLVPTVHCSSTTTHRKDPFISAPRMAPARPQGQAIGVHGAKPSGGGEPTRDRAAGVLEESRVGSSQSGVQQACARPQLRPAGGPAWGDCTRSWVSLLRTPQASTDTPGLRPGGVGGKGTSSHQQPRPRLTESLPTELWHQPASKIPTSGAGAESRTEAARASGTQKTAGQVREWGPDREPASQAPRAGHRRGECLLPTSCCNCGNNHFDANLPIGDRS